MRWERLQRRIADALDPIALAARGREGACGKAVRRLEGREGRSEAPRKAKPPTGLDSDRGLLASPNRQRRTWKRANPGLDHFPDLEAVIRTNRRPATSEAGAMDRSGTRVPAAEERQINRTNRYGF